MLKNFVKSTFSQTCCQIRWMSVFPKHYIDPVYSKTKQQEYKITNEYNKLLQIPTKPSKNDDSLSIFCHDTIKKLQNYIMKGGNKKLARTLLENSFEIIKRTQIERTNLDKNQTWILDPYELVIKAIENCRPLMQLTPIKRGGVTYNVPVPVTEKRSYFLAMKWILEAAREKQRTVHLPEKLAWEILDAAHGQGRVIKRKNDLHKQCEANRAYAHYRWN